MIHIVPTVPPETNGLADYCYRLWEYWPQPRPNWQCLVGHIPLQAAQLWPEVEISQFVFSSAGLVRALEDAGEQTVILHYVGYAYHPKGIPIWLPQALKDWKLRNRGRAHLIVMFHELYANQVTLRQSSYWLKPIAKQIVHSLAHLCDQWVTSCSEYAQRLETETGRSSHKGTIIPVGSNIQRVEGLVQKVWPLFGGNKLKIAVFGLPNTRIWALEAHINLLRQLVTHNLVEAITLIGKPMTAEKNLRDFSRIQEQVGSKTIWHEEYNLSAEEISLLMGEQNLGLLSNHTGVITKSGVYPLLCEHGVIPIIRYHPSYAKDDAFLPYLINNDEKPENCELAILDKHKIRVLQQRIQEAADSELSWQSITRKWQNVVAQLEAK